MDDSALGLDIGLIFLSPLFCDGLVANGIVPITEEHWLHQHKVQFETFHLLGFPKELVDKHTKPVDAHQQLDAVVSPTLIPVSQITDPSEIPVSVEIPPSRYPWFVGRLTPNTVPNIKGMSGGPIFGGRAESNGGFRYWVVAAQSGWYEESRVILGCPVPIFAELIREAIHRHRASLETDEGGER